VLILVLLLCGVDIFCSGLTLHQDPCHGHGKCYAASQCQCDLGYGPEVSYTGERLCTEQGYPCTARQLRADTMVSQYSIVRGRDA
jgi:hypothetical protein